MGEWSRPAIVRPDYPPPRESRYWFRMGETMPAGDSEKAILKRLKQVTRYAYEKAPFYRCIWDQARRASIPITCKASRTSRRRCL